MKFPLIVLLIALTSGAQDQKLRPAIKSIVDNIEKYNRLEQKYVGFAGATTDQYRNFIKLRKKATTEELLVLLHHKNSVVKGYSSWALADNKYPKLYEVLDEFLKTGEVVPNQHGCIVGRADLASEFYRRVYYQHFEYKLSNADSLFFLHQVQQMDSLILYTDYQTPLLKNALEHNHANRNNYQRIKELSQRENHSAALVALAEYKKQEDIPFIISRGEESFLAISVFPDRAFWDVLLRYKPHQRSLAYFLAVGSYKDEQAVTLLSDIYQSCDSVQINLLDEALIKSYCPLYQDLLLKIWEEHKTIDLTITNKLIADCPEKSSNVFAKGLLSDRNFNLLQIDYNYGTDDSILPLMLQTISKYNNEVVLDICKKNIPTAKFMNLVAILNFIARNKIVETTDMILDRLKERNMPFEVFQLTETLLSFKNPDTNKTLTTLLRATQKNWDVGNWSEHFRETFRANGIPIK